MVRSSKGRQKLAMTKIGNEMNLQVTFSKRRGGLFKKASELCTLCGAEIAIIVFSPGKKAFSFGHPNIESVIDRFLQNPSPHSEPSSCTMQIIEANRNATARELNAQLTQIQIQIEDEKKHSDALGQIPSSGVSGRWWETPVESLGLEELGTLKGALQELKKILSMEVQRRQMQIPVATTTATQMQSVYDGLIGTTVNVPEAPVLGGMMDDGVGMNGMMMNSSELFDFDYGNIFF